MRTSAPDLPLAPAAGNRRSQTTTRFTPRVASWNAVLAPITPPPTTTTSAVVAISPPGLPSLGGVSHTGQPRAWCAEHYPGRCSLRAWYVTSGDERNEDERSRHAGREHG